MSSRRTLTRPGMGQGFLLTGLCIGLAGGLAEIVVVWLYAALTGGDAAMIARQVAAAIGLDGASAATGVAVHMALAAALGVGLNAAVQTVTGGSVQDRMVFPFMLGSLAIVWAINFFVVLPVVSPGFVHLLPYGVTLASKLAFGLAAAATLRALPSAVSLWPAQAPSYAGAPVPVSAYARTRRT
jgi:hypothetical protein